MVLKVRQNAETITPIIAKGLVYPLQNHRASKLATHGFASKSDTRHTKKPNARALGFFERCVPLTRNVMCPSGVMLTSSVMCASRVRRAERITSLCAKGALHHCASAQHHCGEAATSLFSTLKFFEIL